MTTSSRHPLSVPTARVQSPKRLAFVATVLAALASVPPADRAGAQTASERLTSRAQPPAPKATAVAVGDEIRTRAGERRRLALPDGSVLYVNADTRAKLDTSRRLTLTSGEVYVEAAPAADGTDPFSIRARGRETSGRAAHFAVRVAPAGAAVVVARGKVEVSGVPNGLTAGEQVAADADRATPAPRASHALGWTRELLAAAESPLVPASKHAGGALLARDPNGDEAKLSLRKYHIDVHIEDGFARTTIDQTYFNDSPAQLEGTFYFPLPPDASLSRLAMYVGGDGGLCQLMEGGMAERDHARQVYETIRYARRDPALLEWVDGSTFKMRVFPLEGRQEKRIVLSYSQRLPVLYDETTYRFPAGHSLQAVRDWSFHARVKGGNGSAWASPSHTLKAAAQGKDLLLTASAKDARIDRDVVLSLHDATPTAAGGVARFSMAEHEKARYLMLRYRPALSSGMKPQRRDWVFLFESSGDRDPLLGRVQIDVIRHLLSKAEATDTFNVLTAGTRVRAFRDEPQKVTRENVAAAITFLEQSHLVGALDLGRALSEAATLLKGAANPCLVHVGSGVPAMGERRHDELAKRIPEGAEYVGVGVGRRWNRSLMKLAAERTGGLFTQINPDEPVAWRAFELSATLNTPRLQRVTVTDADTGTALLCYGTEVAQGEELCAVTRIGQKGALPSALKVRGEVAGKPFEQVVPVRDVAARADYLPRTWAKLEIERLLAEDALKHKKAIIELSKAMYVMTPFTSLLVLENEDLYTQYKVDRGRKDHWALYRCPEKIPLVYEPDPSQPDPKLLKSGAKLPAKQVLDTIVVRQPPGFLTAGSVFRGRGEEGRAQRIQFAPVFVSPDGEMRWAVPDALPEPIPPARRAQVVRQAERDLSALRLFDRNEATIITGPGTVYLLKELDRVIVDRKQTLVVDALSDAEEPALDFAVYSKAADYTGRIPALEKARVGQIIVAGHQVTRDRVIRRVLELHGGDTLGAPILSKIPALSKFLLKSPRAPGAVEEFVGELRSGSGQPPSLLYDRPSFKDDARHFADLLAYAPGMNTSLADMEAVLEAEAIPDPADRPGTMDEAARHLIAKARARGWTAWKTEHGKTPFTILFDGEGRFAYERAPVLGLRERVACDGNTLLHLYPQLGLAARRTVSRFHRADLAAAVPWFVPPAADLARGADLKLIAERTIAIVPHGAESAKGKDGTLRPYARVQLLFGADGALAERQVVRMPKAEILHREVCTADGTLKILDGKGKEVLTRKGTLTATAAPDLTPDTKSLVVLALPYRTRDHVRRTLKIQKKGNAELRFADAIQLLAADVAQGNTVEALAVFTQALHAREQRQLGLYVLLAACGANLDGQNADVLAEHLDDPVAQYLALHSSPVLRKHASQWAVASAQWGDGLLRHLAVSHALLQRWQTDKVAKGDAARVKTETQRALDYVRRHKGTVWGWALLGLMQDRAGKNQGLHAALAECWPLFEDVPGLRYAARYETARSLWKAGKQDEARRAFEKLYADTVKEGLLPAIDGDFRQALLGEADHWGKLLRTTAADLVDGKKRPAVLALAWQCWQLGDAPQANHLLGVALHGIRDKKDRLRMRLAGLGFLWQTGQLPQADKLLQEVLEEPEAAKHASLWRLAADLAGKRDMTARGLECLEKALDVEYQKLPEVIDLSAVRRDYGQLLTHYQNLTDAMVTLKVPPPADFLAKAVRAADRWRALDREATEACRTVARILQRLGDRELGWDYLTTPVGLKPNEAAPWVELAEALRHKGDLTLADRAYTAAFEAEPTNAQLLWDRAQNLRQAGQTVEAQRLLRQLAEGTWQPRFQGLQSQAKQEGQGGP